MSQIFDLCPSFYFMKSRKNNHEKIIKIFPFLNIKIKLGPISSLFYHPIGKNQGF